MGRSRYQVVKGSYKVSFRTVCGENVLRSIKINGNFTLLTPSCVENTLVLENRTGAELILTLTGPRTYQVRVPEGKSKFVFFHDTYRYTVVAACGTRSGKIIIDARLRIWKWKC